jgi:hypothetical protein
MAKITAKLLKDTGSSSNDGITSIDTLTGTASANALITFTVNGASVGTTTANAAGVWTFTPVLNDGSYKVVVSQPGASTSVTFTLDTTASAFIEALVSDTGASPSDAITSNASLTGTGNYKSVVTLTEGTTVLGTATVDNKGIWTFNPKRLAQGSHTILATQTDLAGNVGTAAALTFTVDSVAPVVTERLASDTGALATDSITTNPTLTGITEANALVTLLEGNAVRGTTTADASGNWTITPTGLAQGVHSIVANSTDAAGNTGKATLSFTLDSVAPAVTQRLVSDTGVSATDTVTSIATLAGSGEANALVTLTDVASNTVLGTTTADIGGNWTFVPTGLSEGAHTIVAAETDVAGNTGKATLSFTLDSVAPILTEVLANDAGTVDDNITYDPSLTGISDAGGTVVLTEGATAIGSVTADAAGHWSFTPTGLALGSHTILASDTDLAGNVATALLTFTLQNGTTITSTVAGPVNLVSFPAANPLVITAAGAVVSLDDGVDGTAAGAWTITNDGTVSSANGNGIFLAGDGTVSNGPSAGVAASISGSAAGIVINGVGTVTNSGLISSSYGLGVDLLSGGTVVNSGAASAILGGYSGVEIAGASGTVTNGGSITGAFLFGVALSAGGDVTNSGTASGITGYSSGVMISGSAGTVTNEGTITGANSVYLAAGGVVTNRGIASVISGPFSGVYIKDGVGTVTNEGTIAGTAPAYSFGVDLAQGGVVTNSGSASVISGGFDGVFLYAASGTVTNEGTIIGTDRTGVDLFSGGVVTNNGTASAITGGLYGVEVAGGVGTVTNQGSITGTNSYGVLLSAGGAVANSGTASAISGLFDGVHVSGGDGTVINEGAVTGTQRFGIDLESGGLVANTGTLSIISGGNTGVYVNGGPGAVTNEGTITGSSRFGFKNSYGVYLYQGGTVTNSGTASAISGGFDGVSIYGTSGTVTNEGTIAGSDNDGIELFFSASGVVTNSGSTSTISGGMDGIRLFSYDAQGTVTNAGTITGAIGDGVRLYGGGVVSNSGTASVISGAENGVFLYVASGTVTNEGAISGTTGYGVLLNSGGEVTNSGSGSVISGGRYGVRIWTHGPGYGDGVLTNAGTIAGTSSDGIGVAFSDGLDVSDNTLINSGTIVGNSGTAVQFAAGDDLLRLLPGASFTGLVDGGDGSNTLELAQGALPGSIGGIGASFTGFDIVTVHSGANWTLAGSNTVDTILNNGTLGIAASLSVTVAVDPASTGLFELTDSSLEIAANVGAGDRMSFLGSTSELIIDAASLFGANVGQIDYTGPLIENFGAGDRIALMDIAPAGVNLAYDSASGLLQVVSGGIAASLLFQNSSLGVGQFHSADDGAGHTWITVG